MKVHFLGTAAYEGIPSLFCQCLTCKQARERGGKNIRSRTSVMFDHDLKVDFPPDTLMHSLQYGIDMNSVKDLLITHSHSDHLYAEDMAIRAKGYAQSGEEIMHVYGHDLPFRLIFQALNGLKHNYQFHRVIPFQPVETQTATVVPLLADHDPLETCLLYSIEKNGKTILYGNDSGWFPDETWAWLKNKQFDLVILECTTGRVGHRNNHMNVDAVLETKTWMDEVGVLKPGAQIYVTHFSHNAGLLHEDLVDIFQPHGIEVAYDGLVVEL
ncbi:MBL fold metallo-hydrolase [Paenibacillus chondroitinus]|uniref:MBL fold metallo-hydrolase n=1 Tax=Paenibacillus chondroitinus TaxID=59842 RepID=A0ABU6DM37_9BACL|nr:MULTISPECIES: MBL fold metallo-hydrolase [Paenibacillus]MCY9663170.1 MBL fold metallo-hydrolase [Paenibacillus anseongense]MEB4798853.1 MBL fold metallo-hydrolase [Paenibacillus chondroitinus]